MKPSDFVAWLRGFFAACGDAPLTAAQLEVVRAELAKVAAPPPEVPWLLFPPVQPLPAAPQWPCDPNPYITWTSDNAVPAHGAGFATGDSGARVDS